MRTLALGLILGVSLVAPPLARAQTGTSEIGGKVTDPQGGILPGVAIVITNQDTGVFRELVTGADGSYFVSHIVPGRYRINAKLSGFRSLDRRDVVLTVGKMQILDLTLEVGGVSETVTVSAEAPLVDLRRRHGRGLPGAATRS